MTEVVDYWDEVEPIAYACDGEPFAYFEKGLDGLQSMSDPMLYLLVTRFVYRRMDDHARLVASYAAARMERPETTPQQVLAKMRRDGLLRIKDDRAAETAIKTMTIVGSPDQLLWEHRDWQ